MWAEVTKAYIREGTEELTCTVGKTGYPQPEDWNLTLPYGLVGRKKEFKIDQDVNERLETTIPLEKNEERIF